MPKTYIQLTDLPWGKIGAEWSFRWNLDNRICLVLPEDGAYLSFPRSTFSQFFKEKEPERWMPQREEEFYAILPDLQAKSSCWFGYDSVEKLCEVGNLFKTREHAEEAARRVRSTLDSYHDELGY